jgi:hypothetical protein
VSTTGRGGGTDDDGDAPVAPPIPSFASLRATRRSSPALDVLAPPASQLPLPPVPPPVRESAPLAPAGPRPAEWPDLLRFGVRVAGAALGLPCALVREPARRLRRLLGE